MSWQWLYSMYSPWKIFILFNLSSQIQSFKFWVTKWDVHRKPSGCIQKFESCLKDQHHVWVASWTSKFFHRTSFLFERKIEKLWLFGLGYWQTFPRKWTKEDCHYQENNWQYLLPMISLIFQAKVRILISRYISLWIWWLSNHYKHF